MPEKILINRYRVLDKLGEGGMGLVWKVYDEVEKKTVALKEINANDKEKSSLQAMAGSMLGGSLLGKDLIDTTSKQTLSSSVLPSIEAKLRFSEEFRTMTKLQYPYTVKVFDYGVLGNGNKYITMEFVEGDMLKILLSKRMLDFQEIYKILIQLAQTLNFIHTRLYVHRDIKSDNIIITKDGSIKLIDFGLMDRLGEVSDGRITGTVQYLPPEIPRGGVINESSDLYSLGILAYELITGKFPFNGKELVEIVRMHANEDPPSIRDFRPDVPEELEKIVSRLVEKDQEKRYQSAPELIEELSKLSNEEITTESLEQKKSYLFCSKLIGRDNELSILKQSFENVKSGKGRSIFISAHAGVGKSRLIQEFKMEVQLSEILFFEGFNVEQGMSTFQPFREVFKPLVAMTEKDTLRQYGSILVKIIPELEKKGFIPADTLDEFGEKVRINKTVVTWLKEISQKTPLVICFEDLHWSDLASTDLLNVCIRELRDCPIMFLGTFRDDEVDEMTPLFFSVEENLTQILTLSLLNRESMLQLIEGMMGKIELADDFIDYIFEVTGGNPFFITETLKFLIEKEKIKLELGNWKLPPDINQMDVPSSIGETVAHRLRLLSPEALHLAQVASVMGRELELSILSYVSNFEEDDFFKFLDELLEHQFIKQEEKTYLFTHDRVWETLYSQMNDDEKKELHEKVASFTEERNIKNVDSFVNLLAYHYSRGLNKEKAVKYLLLAGDSSIKKAVYVDFIEYYRRALSTLETIDYPDKEKILFESRNKLIVFSYNVQEKVATEEYLKFLPSLYELGGGEKKVRKMAKVFQNIFKIINLFPPQIAKKIKGTLSKQYAPYQMPKKNDYAHILAILAEITIFYGTALFLQGKYEKQLKVVNDVIENFLPETTGSIDYASVLIARAGAYSGLEKYEAIRIDMLESISVFEENFEILNEKQKYLRAAALFFHNFACADSATLTEASFQKLLKIATENNYYDAIAYCYLSRLGNSRFNGKFSESMAASQSLMDWCKKLGYPKAPHYWNFAYMTFVYLQRRDFKMAEKCYEKAEKLKLVSSGQSIVWNMFCNALYHTYHDNLEKGIPLLEECIEFLNKSEVDDVLSNAMIEVSDAYIKINELEKAQELLKKSLKRVTSFDRWNLYYQSKAYLVLGKLELKCNEYESAINTINKGLKIAEETDNPIMAGQLFMGLSEVYIKLTQLNKAKECLSSAKLNFERIENQYFIEKVQSLLKSI